jgi:hypothetical protein
MVFLRQRMAKYRHSPTGTSPKLMPYDESSFDQRRADAEAYAVEGRITSSPVATYTSVAACWINIPRPRFFYTLLQSLEKLC